MKPASREDYWSLENVAARLAERAAEWDGHVELERTRFTHIEQQGVTRIGWQCQDCRAVGIAPDRVSALADADRHACPARSGKNRAALMDPYWSLENVTARLDEQTRLIERAGDWSREHPAGPESTRRANLPWNTLPAALIAEKAPAQPAPADGPLGEYWQVMSEPLGLSDGELPAYGRVLPGCCRTCLRGPLYPVTGIGTAGQCLYCYSLQEIRKHTGADLARWPRLRMPRLGTVICVLVFLIWTAIGIVLAAGK